MNFCSGYSRFGTNTDKNLSQKTPWPSQNHGGNTAKEEEEEEEYFIYPRLSHQAISIIIN